MWMTEMCFSVYAMNAAEFLCSAWFVRVVLLFDFDVAIEKKKKKNKQKKRKKSPLLVDGWM